MIIVLYIIIFALIYFAAMLSDGTPVIALIMAVLFIYFGWQALSKITPNIFLLKLLILVVVNQYKDTTENS